jgi:S-DNA-T family DNA segregation ATPase FtsK/SpoIIIE
MAKTTLRMNRMEAQPLSGWAWEWRDQFTVQLLGLALAVVGALLFFSLRQADRLPWLVQMTGWTAPLFALGLMTVGGVLALGDRAGYWSVEGLLGMELLLVGLAAGTFIMHNDSFGWRMVADGTNGGLVGWSVGGLLLAAFGRGVAGTILMIMCLTGALLLARYTPLVYPATLLVRVMQWLLAYWAALTTLPEEIGRELRTRPARTANFVAPEPVELADGSDGDMTFAWPKPSKRAALAPVAVTATPAKAGRGRKPRPLTRPVDLPPMDLLNADSGHYGSLDVSMLQAAIESTLEDFGVPVRVVHVESGPTVTQFGIEPLYVEQSGKRRKVRVNRIVSLADDLALALAAPAVRIEAPVPGRPYVGIEVPNTVKTLVALRGILEGETMRPEKGKLLLALGRDTAGAAVVIDLTRAPHLLIAGATGSGKSVCINTIITSLLMQHGPESLRFVMVDPKMVELPGYNGIPHLLGKVITDVQQVMGALTWLLLQMDDRYRLFREAGVRNIDGYNELARRRKSMEPLPYLVLVIDELADLMMTAADDVERQVCRLAQMARATGIHLILATQRPSTDVVTGLIKANFPTRIAFAVTSQIDSRVILDTPGAEQLLGRGDMLVLRPEASKLARVQGCFVADDEIGRVVSHWKLRAGGQAATAVPPWNGLLDQLDHEDEMVQDAIDILRGMKACSTSMLQRKLRIGYPKAARLIEQLERQGIVGPDMGGGQGREVLLREDDIDYEDEYEPA